jgi:hypothetical protein
MIFKRLAALTLIGGLLALVGSTTVRTPAAAQSSQQAISVSVQSTQNPNFITGYNVIANCVAPSSSQGNVAAFPASGGGPIPLFFTLSPTSTCTFTVNGLAGPQVNNNAAGVVSVNVDGSQPFSIPLGATTRAIPMPAAVSVSFGVTYVSSPPREARLNISIDQASVAAIPELASATSFHSQVRCDTADAQGAIRPIEATTTHIFTVDDLTGCGIALSLLAGNEELRPPNIQFRVSSVGTPLSSPSPVPIGQESPLFLVQGNADLRLVLTKVPATPQAKVDVSFSSQSGPGAAVRNHDLEVRCWPTPGLIPPALYARLNTTTDQGRVVSLYPRVNPTSPTLCWFRAQARDYARIINPPNGQVTVKVNSKIVAFQTLGEEYQTVLLSSQARVEFIINYPLARNDFGAVDARRLLDTRTRPDGTSRKLTAGETVRVTLPSGKASAINVTATDSEQPGYLTVYPCGSPQPNASNLNFTVGSSKANLVLAQPGTNRETCVFTSAPTHLIVDHSGTYPTNSSYVPQNPTRLVDTRTGIGGTTRKLNAGETFRLNLGTFATASALTVTVTEPERTGYVTVYPCGSAQPNASNLNFTRNSSVANLVLAKAGPDGYACIFVSDPTHLLVDLSGTFPADSTYSPVAPTRILDTRTGIGVQSGKLVAGQTVRIGVGSGLATALTVTATDADADGYITVYPCDTPLPNVSNLNYGPGDPTANLVLAPMVGRVTCLFTSAATHLIADQSGSHPVPTYPAG